MSQVKQPLPLLDREETKPYWEAAKRHELVVQRCGDCSTWIWYPQQVCHHCNSWNVEWHRVNGKGKVFSWVILRHALHPYFADKLPLPVALIELEEAPEVRITSNIVDCDLDNIHIDMLVEVTFRDIDANLTMPLFRPAR